MRAAQGDGGRPDNTQQPPQREEEEELERKTGVSAMGGGETEG